MHSGLRTGVTAARGAPSLGPSWGCPFSHLTYADTIQRDARETGGLAQGAPHALPRPSCTGETRDPL